MSVSGTPDAVPTVLILLCSFAGLVFAWFNVTIVRRVRLNPGARPTETHYMLNATEQLDEKSLAKVEKICRAISEGAESFLVAMYTTVGKFLLGFALLLLLLLGPASEGWTFGIFSAISFVLGASTSLLSGYIGMRIAVYANGRTAVKAYEGYAPAFNTAFRAGAVMGFCLVSTGVLVLFIGINLFGLEYGTSERKYEAIAAYGLGGSSMALFGRVGGGIYTKAADVGADLVGKVEAGIPEDDPRNPAVIADNVGDNVGDVAGMGADLFGSFAEASCASLVLASQVPDLLKSWASMSFPLLVIATGIVSCILCSFIATNIRPVRSKKEIEPALKMQLLSSTLLQTPIIYVLALVMLPTSFDIAGRHAKNWEIFLCVASGLWAGLGIGYITEYYTSHAYRPVREVSDSCRTGSATNIIFGLALGYKSCIIPAIALAISIYVSLELAGMFGVACAALGMLSTMSIGLTIDAYGPISDNAGGIAEMAGLGEDVRERTDALDAAGNTTAAIGKGFAIGSAALVSLALFGAFVARSKLTTVDILEPFQFAGLLIGAMLPYWFSAMTMKSVGTAALAMVEEVRRQFREIAGIMTGETDPEYKRCVAISTEASLREMIAPGVLVMFTPVLVGFVFGINALAGLLAGALVSGVQMAISSANSGGAWDNAKKYIEEGNFGGKGSDAHKAAVVGDTVGDPLKDTSGPSLNILIKLMAIISLVFAPFFQAGWLNHGKGLVGYLS